MQGGVEVIRSLGILREGALDKRQKRQNTAPVDT